jgi:hypothetical protein
MSLRKFWCWLRGHPYGHKISYSTNGEPWLECKHCGSKESAWH